MGDVHSEYRFPAPPPLEEGCRKAVLGVWDDRYQLGFAHALRVQLYKSPSDGKDPNTKRFK